MQKLGLDAIAATTATLVIGLCPTLTRADVIVPASDGTGTQVTPNGSDYTITGGTTAADQQNLFHSFTEFNLLTGSSATFVTNPAILNILSRVNGGNPSFINGLLQVSGSNANLFLINPNGILFGPDSALNLQGGFTAVTADQVNFAAGVLGTVGTPDYAALVGDPQSYQFSLENPGSVVNAGNLTVTPGETVVLVGGQVVNLGTIAAPGGEIVISAVEGGNLVRLAQTGSLLNLEVAALTDATTAPLLPFSPMALPELLTGSAIAAATNVAVKPDGTIQLGTEAPIEPAPGSTIVTGTLDVSGDQGGQILVLGDRVALTDALLTANGTFGGGQILVGGESQGQGSLPRAQTTTVNGASLLQADALEQGDGGQVMVWAEGNTLFQGLITARGGANGGDGGFVETSGRQSVNFASGNVVASAVQGTAGSWLVDPSDITIDFSTATTIQNALAAGTNFELSTIGGTGGNGDILLDSAITATATNNAQLSLTASRYIQRSGITGGQTINISGGDLVLNVNQEGLAAVTNPTIANALDVVGDVSGTTTVNLGAGTYQEPNLLVIDRDLTLNGAGQLRTLIDGINTSFGAIAVLEDVTAAISNLTIANATNFADGGAIANDGNLSITNSIIRNNRAISPAEGGGRGGGIANRGILDVTDSSILQNIARGNEDGNLFYGGEGGGIYNTGTLQITNGVISLNEASFVTAGSFGNGGGIFTQGGTVTITNSTISGNTVLGNSAVGAGISNQGGTVAIANSTISGNEARGSNANGGGINNQDGFSSDSMVEGSFLTPGNITINNSTIASNFATSNGGGVNNSGGNLGVANSTLSGNTASQGGGISSRGSLLSDGSFTNAGSLNLRSSLLSGNTAASGANVFSDRTFINGGNNLFGSAGNAGVVGISPGSSDIVPLSAIGQILQTTLANNGGPTQTLALLPGSPAINASIGGAPDQRGISAVGPRDIGAFESQGFAVTATTGTPQVTPINQPFGSPLAIIVSSPFNEPVAGGTVTFDSPTSGASANLTPNTAVIGSDGRARVEAIANGTSGTYTVTARITNTDSTATFNLANTSDSSPTSTCPEGDCTPLVIDQPLEADDNTDSEAREEDSGDSFVSVFEDYLDVEAAAFQDFDALDRATAITGVAPALVYASFVSSSDSVEIAQSAGTKGLPAAPAAAAQLIARAEGQAASTAATEEDVLELVLVTANGEPRRFNTGATRTEVLAAVRQLHLELTDRTRRRLDDYLIPAQALYGWLMEPLEAALEAEDIGHVSFILDQGLRSLPLAVLHDGDQFIIENYSVGLMPSLTLTDTRIGNIRQASVLAMGASQFSDQPPLPAVPLELSAINEMWSGAEYLNESFTPERIVQERSEEAYPVLHLATHGQFTNGVLGNSYIQFWDRRLGLDQLPQLQLDEPTVELLVLSACRTVLGGEEAELGFAGLAIKSGAKTAIAALWQVSDLETAGLMAELYSQLGHVSYKAEALRQAQLAMLRGEVIVENGVLQWSGGSEPLTPELAALRFGDTRHPYYWAAFTLVGSPW